MEHTGAREPAVTKLEHARPGQALLAATTQCVPPEPKHPVAKQTQTADVSRHRVVVEVALHDGLEPIASL